MPQISNAENMEQLRKVGIVQSISVHAGALVYESKKYQLPVAEKIRQIAVRYISNGSQALPERMPKEICCRLEGITSELPKLNENDLERTIKKNLIEDISAAREPDPRKLAEGTALQKSKHLRDTECVLDGDQPPTLNTSSLSLVMIDSNLSNGNKDCPLETIRKMAKNDAKTANQ